MTIAEQKDWRKTILPYDSTVQQAIRMLDDIALQIVMVVSPDGVLLGTITDGDIRRGLLQGLNLDSPIESIIHTDAFVAPPDMGRDMVLHLMRANTILQLPVVDSDRRVVGLHIWDDINTPAERPNIMLIMAGGQGSRLRPHTENCPKPMLPIGDKPMLEHIIERAKAEGFSQFIISVHYLGHIIEDHFGDGSRWGINISYLHESSPLGTAGALGNLSPRPELPFLVTNGDVLTDIRYGELLDFHCSHAAAATMAVRQYEWEHPFGVVRTRGVDITGFDEKPVTRSHINAGVYVLEPEVLDVVSPNQHCDMPTLFSRLQEADNRTIVYPMHEPWLDVGREDDLEKANSSSN